MVLLLGWLPLQAGAGGRGDVVLARHPEYLMVYNTYQQRLSRDEGRALVAFTPLIVVKERDVLGDGFTPCLRVKANGQIYFIQTAADGTLLEPGGQAEAAILRGVTIYEDTMILQRSGGVTVRAFDGKSSFSVMANSMLVREFQTDEKTYVRLPASPARYGWVTLAAGEWTRKRSAPELTSDIMGQILPGVRSIVEEANAALRSIYRRLSTANGSSLRPPRFALEEQKDRVTCTFLPEPRTPEFHESIAGLARTLERQFPEGTVRVSVDGNVVTLTPL